MQEQQAVNGVSISQLGDTINAINENPGLARFQFRARNGWIDGGHNRSQIKDFYGAGQEDASRSEPFVLDADEPLVLLGGDQGANPVEFVLHALAACLTTSMVYHAALRGIVIQEVESTLEGDIDLRGSLGLTDEVRKGYQNIRVNFRVKADADAEALKELTKYSPVLDIVSNPVPVTIEVEKTGATADSVQMAA
jgi:uncharacterized OsmC-like protein